MSKKKTTWKKAVVSVLQNAKRPLSCPEIAEIIIQNKLKETSGATPSKTVCTALRRLLSEKNSKIVLVSKGIYSFQGK